MTVIEYVTEEVERQGHDTKVLEGIERVGWMLGAWSTALLRQPVRPRPTIGDLQMLGKQVEQVKNRYGFRDCYVRVGGHICPSPLEVPRLVARLFEEGGELAAIEFYKELLNIHPFEDGNGRTGKIILNWLRGSLLDPIFPPNNLWGREIRNP